MIGDKFNYDDVFLRDLTICVLDTMEGRLRWINRFKNEDVEVVLPVYYSLTGDERFLLDSFTDDIVSNNRATELNTDQIPRGHLTLTNWTVNSNEFRNPNVWMRSLVKDDTETRMALRKVRAIPITATYEFTALLKTEVDVFKCSQTLLNALWLYKPMFFEYEFLHINAMLNMPDNESITISREKNLKSDNTIKLTSNIEVQTYYPAFLTDDETSVRPYRTRWYNNLKALRKGSSLGSNPNQEKKPGKK
jgi:hypothetical protein